MPLHVTSGLPWVSMLGRLTSPICPGLGIACGSPTDPKPLEAEAASNLETLPSHLAIARCAWTGRAGGSRLSGGCPQVTKPRKVFDAGRGRPDGPEALLAAGMPSHFHAACHRPQPQAGTRIELYRCGPGLSTGLPQSDLREGAGLRGLSPAIIQLSRVRREAGYPAA